MLENCPSFGWAFQKILSSISIGIHDDVLVTMFCGSYFIILSGLTYFINNIIITGKLLEMSKQLALQFEQGLCLYKLALDCFNVI